MTTRRILVVADHSEIRRMLRAGLETLGPEINVIDVPSGEEAMLVLRRQPVELMVIDVRLPGISGLELLERLRRSDPGIKLILITGVLDPQAQQQVSQAGAQAFFSKPVEMPAFLGAVQHCLGLGQTGPTASSKKPAASPSGAAVAGTLADPLVRLSEALKAACALLFDGHGTVLARAGDLPGGAAEPELVSALLAAFNASRKAASLLGKNLPEDLLYIAAANYDLYLAPVGQAHVLALALPNDPGGLRLDKVLHLLIPAVEELLVFLAEPPPGDQPASGQAMGTGGLRKLEAVFSQGQPSLKPGELDAFWESAAQNGEGQGAMSDDHISFDEAQKRGLAPE